MWHKLKSPPQTPEREKEPLSLAGYQSLVQV